MNKTNTDPIGTAVTEYFYSRLKFPVSITVDSSITGKEKISVPYLFRSFKKMPYLEQRALKLCNGTVLDVGACTGCHTLYLQKNKIQVTALEISEACCKVMKKRGVQEIVCSDIYKYEARRYDTILMLMNGIGIAGTLQGLKELLRHLKKLLTYNGQILFDSSNIDYAYYEDDGSKWVNLNSEYFGQVQYSMQYKKAKSPTFNWLFIDKEKMTEIAKELNFEFKVLADGSHYDYLGVLKPTN